VYAYSTYRRGQAKTNDPRWLKIRAERLRIDPFCVATSSSDGEMCAEFATEVDHLDGADKSDDSGIAPSWLALDMTRSLCSHHHRVRTAEQSAMSRRRYDS
jgi:hypothetical protein